MLWTTGIRSLPDFGNLVGPLGQTVLYGRQNQIFLGLFSLSLRSTAHPRRFQPTWVRSSTGSYPRFNLAMDRSPSFGSSACD
jgi:hypothetical protein